jgi:hypothetical protein
LQRAGGPGGARHGNCAVRVIGVHSSDWAKENRRFPGLAKKLHGLVDLGDSGQAAQANLIFLEAFAIGAQGFVVERAVRDERVMGGRELHSRSRVEIKYIQRLFHGLDDNFILLLRRRCEDVVDPSRVESCVRQDGARRKETQKRAAIGKLGGECHKSTILSCVHGNGSFNAARVAQSES